jgi:hypothetical protein
MGIRNPSDVPVIHYSTSHANFSRESVGLETAIYLSVAYAALRHPE